jgi:ribose 5-phosphate isomerase B
MKIAVGSDHAGFALKQQLLKVLERRQLEVLDMGVSNTESVDYPDFASRVARAVSRGECERGLLVCGTGIGMSIVANKYRGVRAAVCSGEYEIRMARAHNDVNVLCVGERVVGPGLAQVILEAFLDGPFEGGRHQRRVDKIKDAENET